MRLLFNIILFLPLLQCATPDQWASRSIYQVLIDRFAGSSSPCKDLNNYCGGTWNGLKDKLDYVQGMGFDAIWISPIPHQQKGGYHGYWPDDLTQLNPHFGTSSDLKSLVDAAHSKGMFVMLDVVMNHMSPRDGKFSSAIPFNKEEYYHSCSPCPSSCDIQDWSNQPQVETCRLSGLYDLNQTDPFVRKNLIGWVNTQISTFGFDGLRVDAAALISKNFWKDFVKMVPVYIVGEVENGNIDYVSGYQMKKGPLPAVLNYPAFFVVQDVFAYKNSMWNLQDFNSQEASKFGQLKYLGNFVENHDQARFGHLNSDVQSFKAAMTYSALSIGIPIVYYGSEHNLNGGDDPNNREAMWTSANYDTTQPLYQFVKLLIGFRKQNSLWKEDQIQRYADAEMYSFSRGKALICVTNVGSNSQQLKYMVNYHPYSVGQKICNIFFQGDCVVVTSQGVEVVLNNGESKVFYPSN